MCSSDLARRFYPLLLWARRQALRVQGLEEDPDREVNTSGAVYGADR